MISTSHLRVRCLTGPESIRYNGGYVSDWDFPTTRTAPPRPRYPHPLSLSRKSLSLVRHGRRRGPSGGHRWRPRVKTGTTVLVIPDGGRGGVQRRKRHCQCGFHVGCSRCRVRTENRDDGGWVLRASHTDRGATRGPHVSVYCLCPSLFYLAFTCVFWWWLPLFSFPLQSPSPSRSPDGVLDHTLDLAHLSIPVWDVRLF